MAQTTYSTLSKRGFAGFLDRGLPEGVVTALNQESSAAIPSGVAVKLGTVERSAKKLAASTDKVLGVSCHKHRDPRLAPDGAPAGDNMAVARDGDIYVLCEEAIALGDRVFARAVVGGSEVAGAFRNDADGLAQVTTATPTAANSTQYGLSVSVLGPDGKSKGSWGFTALSDGSGDATEICDAFRTVMQADTAFNALVTSTGTATLVLTSADKANTFIVTSTGTGVITIVATTAAAPDCIELLNAQWISASFTDDNGATCALLRLKGI